MQNRRTTDKKAKGTKSPAQSPNHPPASNSPSQDNIGPISDLSINALQYSAHLKQRRYQNAKRQLEHFKVEYRKRHLAEPHYAAIPEIMLFEVRDTLREYHKAEMLVRGKLASGERQGYLPPDSKSPQTLKADEELIKESFNPNPSVVNNQFSIAAAKYSVNSSKERTNQTALEAAEKNHAHLQSMLDAYRRIYLNGKVGPVPFSLINAVDEAHNKVAVLKERAAEKEKELNGVLGLMARQQVQHRINALRERRRLIRNSQYAVVKNKAEYTRRVHAISKEIFYLENQLSNSKMLQAKDIENEPEIVGPNNTHSLWTLASFGALGIVTLTYIVKAIFGV